MSSPEWVTLVALVGGVASPWRSKKKKKEEKTEVGAKCLSHCVAQVSTPLSSQKRCDLRRSDGSVQAVRRRVYFFCAINSDSFFYLPLNCFFSP